MINLGNHLKTTAHPMHRDKIRSFYKDILRCEMISAPYPDFDLFQFENNVILGYFILPIVYLIKTFSKERGLKLRPTKPRN